MASEYSRVVAFSGNSNAIQALELPAPSYGTLDRFIITQTSPASNTGSGTFKVYDRRSACIGLTDLNVENSGTVSSITVTSNLFLGEYNGGADYNIGDIVSYAGALWRRLLGPNTGYAPGTEYWEATPISTPVDIVFSAAHGLKVGSLFSIKDCDIAVYNTTYTVTSITSSVAVTVSASSASATAITAGVWQTTPFNPRTSPPTSLVYAGTVTAGTTFQAFDLNRGYENKDNQDINLRSRHTGLWLEFTADALDPNISLGWEVAYTCQTNSVD
jgi:hypothetical protein